MIYFTSDMHFGYEPVIDICKRPFKTLVEMDEVLTTNWNQRVSPRDTVYILGDVGMTRKWYVVKGYLDKLNGKKTLIRGNHDGFEWDKTFDKRYFERIFNYCELKHHDRLFILSHYPMLDWKKKYFGAIHLYGHIHASSSSFLQEQLGRCFHVGVDSNNFFPVSADEIIKSTDSINKTGSFDDLYQGVRTIEWGHRERGLHKEEGVGL